MVSITFFVFVALVLIAGFLAATWRRKNKVPLDPDASGRNNEPSLHSNTPFDERPGTMEEKMVPTDNKLSRNHPEDEQ